MNVSVRPVSCFRYTPGKTLNLDRSLTALKCTEGIYMQAAASTVHNPRSCRREDLYQVVQICDYCSAKLKRTAGLKFMLADCIPTQTIATVS